uniref:Uncharacterized protein n=1 Tax=Rhizophora mucronata TaxID=61149 RepID=A0A2P2N5E0_RHIMU
MECMQEASTFFLSFCSKERKILKKRKNCN